MPRRVSRTALDAAVTRLASTASALLEVEVGGADSENEGKWTPASVMVRPASAPATETAGAIEVEVEVAGTMGAAEVEIAEGADVDIVAGGSSAACRGAVADEEEVAVIAGGSSTACSDGRAGTGVTRVLVQTDRNRFDSSGTSLKDTPVSGAVGASAPRRPTRGCESPTD